MTKPQDTSQDLERFNSGAPAGYPSGGGRGEEELIRLLQALQHDCQSLQPSSRRIVLEHAMRTCHAILNNQLELEWYRRLHELAQLQNQRLSEQLALMLDLLEVSGPSDPDGGGDGPVGTGRYNDEAAVIRRCWRSLKQWLKSSLIARSGGDVTATAVFPELATQYSSSQKVTSSMGGAGRDSGGFQSLARLDVYCFGAFRLYQDHEPVESWPKGRAKQLLKYLILNRASPVPKEVLMDRFWPDLGEGNARNNLNVAVYGLRQSLKKEGSKFVHVLFQDGCYLLNPDLDIWIDVEEFDRHLKAAAKWELLNEIDAAVEELDKAEKLYQGDFLAEDLYEDWTSDLREGYRARYLELLRKLSDFQFQRGCYDQSIEISRKILATDAADEPAHRRLMECFSRMGQRHLALRQYQMCQEALKREFGLRPTTETTALYEQIKDVQDPAADGPAYGSTGSLRYRNA